MLLETIDSAVAQFAADVREGLQNAAQKRIPSKYLYDSVGSLLFDAIAALPEYGLTRADERLLMKHSADLAGVLPVSLAVCELGSGSGRKTRRVLETLSRRRAISYSPIDISATALAACERELAGLPGITVTGIESEYLAGLSRIQRRAEEAVLVLFLGSTIGNFAAGADCDFLRSVARALRPGDYLLLGTDLVKPLNTLIAAYDDSIGITAAFNLNLLARMNRELGADFRVRQFEHVARFNESAGSVEMHLRSRRAQTAQIPAAECSAHFHEGETIWTESSHKYTLREIADLAERSGFHCERQWVDQEWQFAETLFRVPSAPLRL